MKTIEEELLQEMRAIIAKAAAAGLVATISLDHQNPAAGGQYPMVAAVRQARFAPFPDPAKMEFDHNSPDKYNAALRVDSGTQRRRRND